MQRLYMYNTYRPASTAETTTANSVSSNSAASPAALGVDSFPNINPTTAAAVATTSTTGKQKFTLLNIIAWSWWINSYFLECGLLFDW